MKKALIGMKDEENIVEITTLEKMRVDMMKEVGEEHIYENPKNKNQSEKVTPLAPPLEERRKK